MGHRDPKARAAVAENTIEYRMGHRDPKARAAVAEKNHGIRYGSQRPEGQSCGSREIPLNNVWVTETRRPEPR